MNGDSRMAIYISVMTLILSCVGLGYGVFFWGWGAGSKLDVVEISPGLIISVGLIIAAVNGVSANLLSDQLSKRMTALHPTLRFGIPLAVFLVTLALSLLIALVNA